MMGSTKIESPSPAPQPSTAEAIQAWVESMPQVYETQLKYAPQEAAQQVALAQQYAQPLGEAYLAAQKAMYPEEYALREDLMAQAQAGMESEVPDWMRQQYLDEMRGQLGEQAAAGIGADYMSRGLLQQQQDWRNYYQNMALSLSGSQPIYQAQTPGYSNYMSGYTPSSVMGYTAQTYAPYASAYANMYGTNAQVAMQNQMMPYYYMTGVGNVLSGVGGFMGG